MKAKDATLLTSKMTQLKKMVNAIKPKENDPASTVMQNNSIVLLNGLIKDVGIIFEKDKQFNSRKENNSGIYKTGYPCNPIKNRKRKK